MKPALFLTALLSFPAFAGEHTVKSEAFETSISIDARFLPTDVNVIEIEPEHWSSFVIKDLAKHGSIVKKGDSLLVFENEDFDKALAEARESAKSRAISLAMAKRELSDLEKTTALNLEAERLKFERNKESFDYFTKTGRALEEEQIAERLDAAKRSLSYTEEELKQLLKMYEEDGLTEETEEIILKRQRSAVKSSLFNLKRTEISTQWDLEKNIPRKAVDLQASFDNASLAYETAKLNLPRALEQKRLSVAKAIRDDAEADKKLAEFEADKALLSLTAPADGTIYYGEIADGSWSLGNTSKFLFEKGSVPADTSLMTLVPTGSPLALHGTLNQEQRLKLPADAQGTAEVKGLEDSAYPVTVSSLEMVPDASGNYKLALKVELPETSPVVAGMNATVKLFTYRSEEAVVIPKAALTTKDGKSTVKVKMADGKDEVREVKVGRRSADKVEILEGLTADQVVLLPDSQ
ncbi:hypothetical protein V2O64_06570 [Verrucomicrobiaceae bacterium 227]